MPDYGEGKENGSHMTAVLLTCSEHATRYAGLWMG